MTDLRNVVDLLDLLTEEIFLVKEEDDWDGREPLAVANLVKKLQAFVHAVRFFVLIERQVVLTHGDEEEHGCHVLEAMDPLLTLRTLSADIYNAVAN